MTKIVFQNDNMLTLGGKLIIPVQGVGPEPGPVPQDEVQIGDQIWKSKNLAIDDGQEGIYTQTVNYGDGEVVEYYYTWEAAVRVAGSVSGWHLPTRTECDTLNSTVGSSDAGTKLKSSYGWSSGNGTDNYGFAALPAGVRYTTGEFMDFGVSVRFWTSDERSSTNSYYYSFGTGATMTSYNSYKSWAYTLRLIKDAS